MEKEKETNDEREIWKVGWVATTGTSSRMRERKSDKFKIKNRATCVCVCVGKKNKKETIREKREMSKEEETNDEREIWEVGLEQRAARWEREIVINLK